MIQNDQITLIKTKNVLIYIIIKKRQISNIYDFLYTHDDTQKYNVYA